MHLLCHKINTINSFCNAEMAKLGNITFKCIEMGYSKLFSCI